MEMFILYNLYLCHDISEHCSFLSLTFNKHSLANIGNSSSMYLVQISGNFHKRVIDL